MICGAPLAKGFASSFGLMEPNSHKLLDTLQRLSICSFTLLLWGWYYGGRISEILFPRFWDIQARPFSVHKKLVMKSCRDSCESFSTFISSLTKIRQGKIFWCYSCMSGPNRKEAWRKMIGNEVIEAQGLIQTWDKIFLRLWRSSSFPTLQIMFP